MQFSNGTQNNEVKLSDESSRHWNILLQSNFDANRIAMNEFYIIKSKSIMAHNFGKPAGESWIHGVIHWVSVSSQNRQFQFSVKMSLKVYKMLFMQDIFQSRR